MKMESNTKYGFKALDYCFLLLLLFLSSFPLLSPPLNASLVVPADLLPLAAQDAAAAAAAFYCAF